MVFQRIYVVAPPWDPGYVKIKQNFLLRLAVSARGHFTNAIVQLAVWRALIVGDETNVGGFDSLQQLSEKFRQIRLRGTTRKQQKRK